MVPCPRRNKLSKKIHPWQGGDYDSPHFRGVKKCGQTMVLVDKLWFHPTVPRVQLLHHYQCKDNRSTYGRNIRNILKDSNCRSLKEVDLSRIIINPVPVGCEWKVNFLKYLIKDRYNPQSLLSPDVIWTVMCHICVD